MDRLNNPLTFTPSPATPPVVPPSRKRKGTLILAIIGAFLLGFIAALFLLSKSDLDSRSAQTQYQYEVLFDKPVEVGEINEELYQALKDDNYELEVVAPTACGEDASYCKKREPLLGWYAVENKSNGYRVNLSSELFRPYAFGPRSYDPGTESVEKVGSSIYLLSDIDSAIYEFRIPAKKIFRLYQNKEFSLASQTYAIVYHSLLITGWNYGSDHKASESFLLVTDLSSSERQSRIYRFEALKGVLPENRRFVIDAIDTVAPAQRNYNLIWVIPHVEQNEPSVYPIVHLDTGEVEYQARSQMMWEDQPK